MNGQNNKVYRMIKLAAMAAIAATASVAEPGGASGGANWGKDDCIDGRADKPVPVYAPGEQMVFTFRLRGFRGLDRAKHFLKWERTADDGLKSSGREPITGDVVLKTSLDRPGFVRYYAELVDESDKVVERFVHGKQKVFFDGGAGVDILSIRQGAAEPKDFDAFWARHRAELAKVSWKDGVKIEKLDSGVPDVDLYSVSIPCAGGKPSTGFLTVPRSADGRKYPAHIGFSGYGGSWMFAAMQKPGPKGIRNDVISLRLCAHGLELCRDRPYYRAAREAAKSNGYDYAFDPAQNSDPEKAYFCGMTYRVMRALEYLKSRPEWNGKDLVAGGWSMGGLQAIWAGALDHDVTKVDVQIPWCCDIGGTEIGRNRGKWYVQWVPALGYYDPVNMARRIPKTCEVRIARAGLGDYTCPPTGVMAFYNNLSCPTSATFIQNAQHGSSMPKPRQAFRISKGKLVEGE